MTSDLCDTFLLDQVLSKLHGPTLRLRLIKMYVQQLIPLIAGKNLEQERVLGISTKMMVDLWFWSCTGFQWDKLKRDGEDKCVQRYTRQLCLCECAELHGDLPSHHHWIPGHFCQHTSSDVAAMVREYSARISGHAYCCRCKDDPRWNQLKWNQIKSHVFGLISEIRNPCFVEIYDQCFGDKARLSWRRQPQTWLLLWSVMANHSHTHTHTQGWQFCQRHFRFFFLFFIWKTDQSKRIIL